MISAASHQLIFFAMAFNSPSCILIIRSTSAAGYRFGFSNHSASPVPLPQSGQITCEFDRTDHILTTPPIRCASFVQSVVIECVAELGLYQANLARERQKGGRH